VTPTNRTSNGRPSTNRTSTNTTSTNTTSTNTTSTNTTSTNTTSTNRNRTRGESSNWPRLLKFTVLGASLAVLLAGCVGNPTQSTLKVHGAMARLENTLFVPVFWIAVGVFCLIAGLVLYCVFRFRARSEDEAPKQVHGNTKFEIAWTIAPAVLLVCIAIPTVKFTFDLNDFPSNAPVINVIGHRWWWEMDYTNPANSNQVVFDTATELHIPINTKVIITLTSDDVIHNFWVPELAGKLYAIPGRHNKMVLEADTANTYYGQCSEFCGTSHANMRLTVVAQTPAAYAAWFAAQEAPPVMPVATTATATGNFAASTPAGNAANVAAGFNDFKIIGCAGCHTINGISDGVVGPNLTHFKSRALFAGAIFANTDPNLRLWLQDPPLQKPGSVMPDLHLSETQITDLIAYLDTLK